MTVITADGRWLRTTFDLERAGYVVTRADLRRPLWPVTACLCGVDVAAVVRRGPPATVLADDGFYDLADPRLDHQPPTPHVS